MIEFLFFRINKKWKRLPLIALLLIIAVFIFSQIGAVFHYPVKNQSDLEKLKSMGHIQYLYRDKTDIDMKYELKKRIEEVLEKKEADINAIELQDVLNDIDTYNNKELVEKYENNQIVYAFLMENLSEIETEYKPYSEINKDILKDTQNKGYQMEFQTDFITYIQAIMGFLMVAFVILTIKEDDRYKIRESTKVTKGTYLSYYIIQIATLIIPIICFTYVLGIGVNLYSYAKFYLDGYDIVYLPISTKYWGYFIPTLFCFSSVSIFIISMFKNYMSVIPFYLMWVIFNVTPDVVKLPEIFKYFIVLHRLDRGANISTEQIVFKQVMILVFSAVLLAISYNKRKGEQL